MLLCKDTIAMVATKRSINNTHSTTIFRKMDKDFVELEALKKYVICTLTQL
ncbi:hypothetical protein MBAV_003901 [Candidatus Magnetobacterium bavaricum]|uniref:Uncharacterized protein n=1 Tax=Candidatus Magnetobacterium bavaricum TaxID=29290 RepID=A0A0F3GTA4_9BACT|nr:hypothetical protein MBAV_003901 [Candidatus Magnetobacterium bavaricum]